MKQYDTDKFIHGLIDEYEKLFKHLKDKKLKILEIGIFKGGSLQWLSDYFKKSEIIGIDLYVPSGLAIPRVKMLACNQNDSDKLAQISETYGPFDLIIDDGSHHHDDTKNTFESLFGLLKPGGIYIIEDWIAGYWPMPEYKGINDLVFEIAKEKNNCGISDFMLILKEPKCSIAVFKKANIA